jgi:hypothetical protein
MDANRRLAIGPSRSEERLGAFDSVRRARWLEPPTLSGAVVAVLCAGAVAACQPGSQTEEGANPSADAEGFDTRDSTRSDTGPPIDADTNGDVRCSPKDASGAGCRPDATDTGPNDTSCDAGGPTAIHPEPLRNRIPEVAEGYDVGAVAWKSAEDFHDGRFFDITNYGAVPGDGEGDSEAIETALEDARAVEDGAVLIPEGTFLLGETDRLAIDLTDKSGARIIGRGYESLLKMKKDRDRKYAVVHLRGTDEGGALENVHIANLHVDANRSNQPDGAHGNGILAKDEGQADGPITIENIWVHGAPNSNVNVSTQNTTVRRITTWNTFRWHGVGANNVPPNAERTVIGNVLAFRNGNSNDKGGLGIDASSGRLTVRNFVSTRNQHGMKTSTDTLQTRIKNGRIVNNRQRGFYMSGNAKKLTMDDVVSRGNGDHGISFTAPGWSGEAYKSTVEVGSIYAVGNGTRRGEEKSGVVLFGPMELTSATRIESCGNGGAGLKGIDAYGGPPSGSIQELMTKENGGGRTKGELQNVSIDTVTAKSCDPPVVLPTISESSSDC